MPQQVKESGKSILFLLEANPGPGLGILLAFTFFGVGVARSTAPGAIIIQFFGGIHEIYFPFVLQKPILFIAVILGGATGVATNVAFHSGLVGPASPGSIIAVLANTSRDSYVGVILSVVLSAAVSGVVASFFLIATRKRDLANADAGDMSAAFAKMQASKGRDANAATAGLFAGASVNGATEEEDEATFGGVGSASAPGRPRPRLASRTSSSPATPAWARRRWARACSATRSRRPASRGLRWSTRPSRTSRVTKI